MYPCCNLYQRKSRRYKKKTRIQTIYYISRCHSNYSGLEILAGGIKSAYTNLNEFNATLQFLKTLKANDIGKEQIPKFLNPIQCADKKRVYEEYQRKQVKYLIF